LNKVEGIAFQFFDETDVVRHRLVQAIVHAYREHRGLQEERF
jgi:phosphate starvation-inducible PhoH-like protein